MSKSRRCGWRPSRPPRSCGAGRPSSRSPPSPARHSAVSASRRPRHRRRGPRRALRSGSCTKRYHRRGQAGSSSGWTRNSIANVPGSSTAASCRPTWSTATAIAEAAIRPWTPVFMHGDLQITHIFTDGDEVTGVIDWSEAAPGDALFDLAILTLGHEERLEDLLAGYGVDVDRDVIRAWWSLRSLLASRWLIEHGFDPSLPGCEFDVLRSRM
ncbi:phosphotransferase family protein [Micromonospora sp. HUAS LYJ1]|uniref:phosphotransferase family protein n=1 Tax=Micromonospora sp. HUAS LYJ1 TaxID=3061626 RepID=UPI0034A01927